VKSAHLAPIILLCFASLAAPRVAYADTIGTLDNLGGYTGLDATADLSLTGATGWKLTFTLTNDTHQTIDLNQFAIELFSASGTTTVNPGATLDGVGLVTPGGAWEYSANENSNNGSGTCKTSGSQSGWICADTDAKEILHPYSVSSGASATFVFTGTDTTGTLLTELSLMASGCAEAGTCWLDGGHNNANKWAV